MRSHFLDLCAAALVLMLAASAPPAGAQPTTVSYQGTLVADGQPFDGTAQFKFAIISVGESTFTLWSNDGTSQNGSEPQGFVSLDVDQGIFSAMLGGTGMVEIEPDELAGAIDPRLRVWVNTGSGFEQLSDQALASSVYSLSSETAWRSIAGFTADGIIHSTTGGFRFPDGTTQTTAATGGGGGGTLDQAYDHGGAGAGRVIVADAGAVEIQGSDGLSVLGRASFGTTARTGRLSVEHSGVGTTDPALYLNNSNTGSSIAIVGKSNGTDATAVFSNTGSGDLLRLFNGGGSPVVQVLHSGKLISSGLQVTSGAFQVDGSSRLRMNGAFGNGVGGAAIYSENTSSSGISFWGKASGSDATMVLEQNGTGSMLRGFKSGQLKFEVQNSGRVVTPSVQITGGADLAEPFAVSGGEATPGMVLVIDDARPGHLTPSTRPYDTRVAGIVSGAGGIAPGITMTADALPAGGQPVALSGRVHALADASPAPIRPGDLLTTSSTRGHLMKATDLDRARGAVIGKAMTGLESGRGQVLVLVSLQ